MFRNMFGGRRASMPAVSSPVASSSAGQGSTPGSGAASSPGSPAPSSPAGVPTGFAHRPSSMKIKHKSTNPAGVVHHTKQTGAHRRHSQASTAGASPSAAAPTTPKAVAKARRGSVGGRVARDRTAEARMEVWQMKRLVGGIHTRLATFLKTAGPDLTPKHRAQLQAILRQIPSTKSLHGKLSTGGGAPAGGASAPSGAGAGGGASLAEAAASARAAVLGGTAAAGTVREGPGSDSGGGDAGAAADARPPAPKPAPAPGAPQLSTISEDGTESPTPPPGAVLAAPAVASPPSLSKAPPSRAMAGRDGPVGAGGGGGGRQAGRKKGRKGRRASLQHFGGDRSQFLLSSTLNVGAVPSSLLAGSSGLPTVKRRMRRRSQVLPPGIALPPGINPPPGVRPMSAPASSTAASSAAHAPAAAAATPSPAGGTSAAAAAVDGAVGEGGGSSPATNGVDEGGTPGGSEAPDATVAAAATKPGGSDSTAGTAT